MLRRLFLNIRMIHAAQPEPKQNDNYAQSAGTQPEKPEIPVKAEAEKQPQQPPMPTVQAAPEQGGISEFEHWAEFMDIIHKTDIALFGVLSGAGAHFDSGRFVIDSPNPTIKQFIQIPTHLKAIKPGGGGDYGYGVQNRSQQA